jgi:hydrogenase nickel incorporation protein HypB
MTKKIEVEKKVLSENDRRAEEIRRELKSRNIFAMNLVSSPGSGKTSLLERTLATLKNEIKMAVIAGDVQTENDANRLIKAGGDLVRPIITGGACHLDAKMVDAALKKINLDGVRLLFIENVGNLVCPSSYDLGEDIKAVLISATEGDDKPLKYPAMFRKSSIMVINKIDLLGLSDFDMAQVKRNALQINGNLKIFEISCRTGEGLDKWNQWLREVAQYKGK